MTDRQDGRSVDLRQDSLPVMSIHKLTDEQWQMDRPAPVGFRRSFLHHMHMRQERFSMSGPDPLPACPV
jgi:hypothetical protein